MTTEQLNLYAAVATSVGTLIGTWFLVVKLVRPLFRRTVNLFNTWEGFIRDWAGTQAEPGRDAIPGVMERLNRIDGELKHNGGSSMKDQLARLESEMEKADLQRRETNIKIDEILKMLKSDLRSKSSRSKNS